MKREEKILRLTQIFVFIGVCKAPSSVGRRKRDLAFDSDPFYVPRIKRQVSQSPGQIAMRKYGALLR